MKNMTYAQALEIAITTVENTEVVEKLTALKAQLEKRNSGERKPTKTQKENEEIKVKIADLLTSPMTASEVGEALGISNQKASALLTAMVKAETVERFTEKRKAYFKLIEG